jgi:hypothetical protein
MSNYHGKEFLGFGTSVPPNVIPDPIFRFIFFPKIPTKRGMPVEAPYGLRKIEAKLLDEGFDALTTSPIILKITSAKPTFSVFIRWIRSVGDPHPAHSRRS